jgi:methyl acetate hydrolase
MVTGRQEILYACAAGRRNVDDAAPMTTDPVFALYSCTKALTATAVMQLVESGTIALDDPAERYVPELADILVLDGFADDGEPRLRPAKTPVTVRQLLLHTAGFGYEFFNPELLRFVKTAYARNRPNGLLPAARAVLVRDPGTRWEYGASIDWVGLVVERVRGEPLGVVLSERILAPLDMRDTAFRLSAPMAQRRAAIHLRGADGRLTARPEIGLPVDAQADTGGSGLFGTAGDYLKFVRMILRGGTGAGGVRILEPATVEYMAQNGLGSLAVTALPGTMPALANDAEFFPGTRKSWGYSWMINDEPAPTGRPAGTLGWAGLANLYYWIDRRNGIGGFWATQILPFIDAVSFGACLEFEATVYAHLNEEPTRLTQGSPGVKNRRAFADEP